MAMNHMTYEHALPSILHLRFKPVRGFESETAELTNRRRDAEGERDTRAAKKAHDEIWRTRPATKGRTIERAPLYLTALADGD